MNLLAKKVNVSRQALTAWMAAFVLLMAGLPGKSWSQCTSITSAVLTASPDDVGNFWLDGVFVNTFAYTSKGTGAQPQSYSLPASILSLISIGGTNCLAAQNINTTCCEMSMSWVLDITCNNGQHAYMTSDNLGNLTAHYDGTGCCPPPNDSLGNPWYSPNWTAPATYLFNYAPACENEFFWAKRIFNPMTGQLACALAPSAAENPPTYTPPNDMYYRECMPLTFVTPPGPPNFSIAKTALGPVSQINTGMPVTYQAVICNSGGAVSTGVTIIDNIPPGLSYDGPWSPSPPQGPYGNPFIFSEGFPGAPLPGPGSACVTLTYWLIDYSVQQSDWCQPKTNSVSVSGYGASSSAVVTMYCPTNTFTFTPTYTFTPTNTFTPTPSYTKTPLPLTSTPTGTYTFTFTYTPTPTWTYTFAPGTYTPTNTYTPTSTFSPTPTFTKTITPTPGPGCRLPVPVGAPLFAFLVENSESANNLKNPNQSIVLGCYSRAAEGLLDPVERKVVDFKAANTSVQTSNGTSCPEGIRRDEFVYAVIRRGKAYVRPV